MSLYQSQVYLDDLEAARKAVIHFDKLSGRSVLVTGATGTIGSFLVDVFSQYNKSTSSKIKVYAASRSAERLKARFDAIKTDDLIYLEYDLLKPISFSCDIDYIIHAAGNAHPAVFTSNPVETIVGNVEGTHRLLEYGRSHGTNRFLYVSSGEVYGQCDVGTKEFEENYVGYVDLTSPRSCYPLSKRLTENLCVAYTKEYALETVIVRPCHTYGPGLTQEDNRANAQFIKKAIRGENIVLNSPGTQTRSYCYVADCVSALLTVLLNGTCGEAYNLANPQVRITIAEFAEVIAEFSGKEVFFASPTASEMAERNPFLRQVLSTKKLEALGWRSHFGLKEGVAHTLTSLMEL